MNNVLEYLYGKMSVVLWEKEVKGRLFTQHCAYWRISLTALAVTQSFISIVKQGLSDKP